MMRLSRFQEPTLERPLPPLPSLPPAPPSPDILKLLERQSPEPTIGAAERAADANAERDRFKFAFRHPWFGGYFTIKKFQFVLRTQHYEEMIRLTHDFNRTRPKDEFPITLSDVVAAALDFVLDHEPNVTGLASRADVREVMAEAVLRKAHARFIQLHFASSGAREPKRQADPAVVDKLNAAVEQLREAMSLAGVKRP